MVMNALAGLLMLSIMMLCGGFGILVANEKNWNLESAELAGMTSVGLGAMFMVISVILIIVRSI